MKREISPPLVLPVLCPFLHLLGLHQYYSTVGDARGRAPRPRHSLAF